MDEDSRPLLGVPKIHRVLRRFRKKNHCVYKASTLKKCVVFIIFISILLIIFYSQYVGHSPSYLTG